MALRFGSGDNKPGDKAWVVSEAGQRARIHISAMNIGVACLGRLHNVTAAFLQHESVRRAAPTPPFATGGPTNEQPCSRTLVWQGHSPRTNENERKQTKTANTVRVTLANVIHCCYSVA